MYINTFRLLAFVILFAIIIIVEIPFKKLFKDPTIQLYIAIFCIAILMLLDNITGFILTIGVLVIYFRIYTEEIKNKRERENMENINDNKDKPRISLPDVQHAHHVHVATSTSSVSSATTVRCIDADSRSNISTPKDIADIRDIKDVSKEHNKCDKDCDKCSMEMPKKKNIFNEFAVDNFVPYITEENLLAAQTNIIDVDNYNLCIDNKDIDVLDIKRGPLCDIQGLQDIPDLGGDNKRLRGYDAYNSRLGDLTYDIL
jgi:hypothetical protein